MSMDLKSGHLLQVILKDVLENNAVKGLFFKI